MSTNTLQQGCEAKFLALQIEALYSKCYKPQPHEN